MTAPESGGALGPPEPRRAGDANQHSGAGTSDSDFGAPNRRTYLAEERTLLAWWRTALSTIGIAVAIGALLPKLTDLPEGPLVGLGAGYALLSLCFALLGGYRHL